MRWVVATANAHKVRELATLLGDFGVELAPRPEGVAMPEETGASFLANARIKARAVAAATGEIALADDSGLEVDALGGDPGVRSARYAGDEASDADNNAKLLAELSGIHGPNRRARFRCVLALVGPDGKELTAEGRCEGFVLESPRGAGGFGYDPLFQPEGDTRALAEYAEAEKNAISHRGHAVRRLREMLERLGRTAP
ncbi:MAG: RdgB/HAM1 family non-canonical purine NTP pyrophosphatase [Candidatus Eisenbacteria bacterium]